MKLTPLLLLVSAGLLGGCETAAQKAERRYEIVEKSGDHRAQCEEAGKVAEAYLDAGDQQNYESWKSRRNIYCQRVQLDEHDASEATNPLL